MTNRETWLQSIRSNPSDWQAMLVFADWLEEEEGDLLAAEQWRFLAAMSVCGWKARVRTWPTFIKVPDPVFAWELPRLAHYNIRCMPAYPLTIEDVHAYLETAR